MNVKVFAAIDIGSFETAMKIYEISAKNGWILVNGSIFEF